MAPPTGKLANGRHTQPLTRGMHRGGRCGGTGTARPSSRLSGSTVTSVVGRWGTGKLTVLHRVGPMSTTMFSPEARDLRILRNQPVPNTRSASP